VADVFIPLLALGFDDVLEVVLAQRVANQVVLLEFVECVAQVGGQVVDAQVAPFAMARCSC
jgi:hypothetical protein